MAGGGGTLVEDTKLKKYFGCSVIHGILGIPAKKYQCQNIPMAKYTKDKCFIWCGRTVGTPVDNRKLEGYFGCGVCKRQCIH